MEHQNDLIKVEIIADSINKQGDRLTTMLLMFPRIVLAEFNTHRVLSKNSASSRAIPFKRMVKMVKERPFIPTRWMKEHKGMQGTEFFEYSNENRDNYCDPVNLNGGFKVTALQNAWLRARDKAVEEATFMHDLGLSKQICNRILEPYMMHTVLVTGSDWENFFALRAHKDAEIHIQELAYKMLNTYNDSTPIQLQPGEWHIPFGDRFDEQKLYNQIEHDHGVYDPIINEENARDRYKHLVDLWKVKIATARCARTSYLNFEGKDDYEADMKLHDQLLMKEPIHASPAEHCAQAMSDYEYENFTKTYMVDNIRLVEKGWCRNFRGFIQYRTLLKNDTARDLRVNKR
jgi:thymidylate synthase ThyX